MSYNFVNEADSITASHLCRYDSNIGYETDFSVDGEVDGWDSHDGVHTIGAWGGYLFATLYGDTSRIGRSLVFYPVPAETHYTLRITMKINPSTREAEHVLPTTGRVMWATLANPTWGTDKQKDFTIYPDNYWHTYILNMGEEQWWQGDVNNLRVYPILTDGYDGDEFFVKSIKITSVSTFRCIQATCSYYSNYNHPCGGIGERGYCKSSAINAINYTIEEDVNDELVININDYGNEIVRLPTASGVTGNELSKSMANEISKTAIGGYAEVEVEYTEDGEFKIHSGTYATDSSVIVSNSSAASTLGFFSTAGADLSSTGTGTYPASLFLPASSFKIKSFQLLSLFDNSVDSSFVFDPSIYSIEGGRRDWAASGLGVGSVTTGDDRSNTVAQRTRDYNLIDNVAKTIIDFNHPFNASGRIKKISLACTLDHDWAGTYSLKNYQGRVEGTGCKVLILRPKKNGNLEVVESVAIPDRDYSSSRLYSPIQEASEIDCDVWVNKGDFLGVYNANVYIGKSTTGSEIDALYYQVDGEASGEFTPGRLNGDGIGGMLIYARSEIVQNKLLIDVDLGNRINIEDVDIIGSSQARVLEFNVARCLDINWSVDLFDGTHYTGFKYLPDGGGPDYNMTFQFWHQNIAYGNSKLTDGILTVPEGYAATGYSVGTSSIGQSTTYNPGNIVATFVPTGVQYFFVNGDQEWLGIYQHIADADHNAFVKEFEDDPISFTLLFPYGTSKSVYKSKIYFKEKGNFRNFALSTSNNLDDVYGDADIPNFTLIPEYAAVTIDNNRFTTEANDYNNVKLYLFANPCNAKPVLDYTGERTAGGSYIAYVTNNEENLQANNIDWTILEHEFDSITCKGFRFYCNHHLSTKITEMELYCQTEDEGSSLIGGLSLSYSQYGELWWASELTENDDGTATAFVGDTPRYVTIEIEPITKIELNEIIFNVKSEDGYIGTKGCEYDVLPIHGKSGVTNEPTRLDIKNVYDGAYDLYVDIVKDTVYKEGLIFHSTMSNADSITNPEVGPDARYSKEEDYPLVNNIKNCAINDYCYGLRNLIDGKQSHYSYMQGFDWQEFGTLTSGVSIDFSNITGGGSLTELNIPVFSRNRYYKIGWLCGDHTSINVREAKVFYNDVEYDCVYYNDTNLPIASGPMADTAPHLNNNSPTGSYYKIQYDTTTIGVDLGTPEVIDKIIFFHDTIPSYDETYCGIDEYTELCLTVKDGDIVDYSYDERSFTIVGSGIEPATGYWDFGGTKTALGFSGYSDSYISVPASSAWYFTGATYYHSWYGPPFNEALTIDFFVAFDSLPTTSGHCTLIRNWADPVSTDKYGDIPFPPLTWMDNHAMEHQASARPNANWAIFVKNENNLTAANRLGLGGSYATSALQTGNDYTCWDNSFSSNNLFKNSALPNIYTQINLPAAKKVNRYGVYSYTPGTISRVLRNFKFQAYVTASGTWLDLHSVTGFTVSTIKEMTYYDFTNPYPACTNYRILISANNGDASYTLLNEVELYDGEENDLCQLEFWVQSTTPYGWAGGGHMWHRNVFPEPIVASGTYNVCLYRRSMDEYQENTGIYPYNQLMCYVNGVAATYGGIHQERLGLGSYAGPLTVGAGLDGVMTDVRITKDLKRLDFTPALWHSKERLYTMTVYVSDDNVVYSKLLDMDLKYDNSYSYHFPDNKFSESYYSYFAIDLANRYDLDWIRTYGSTTNRFELSFYGENSELIDYSNDETDDVELVTWTGRDAYANNVMLQEAEWSDWSGGPSDPAQATVSFSAKDCTGMTKANGMLMIDVKYTNTPADFDKDRGMTIEMTSAGTYDQEEWAYAAIGELENLLADTWLTLYLPLNRFTTTGGELNVSAINYMRLYGFTQTGGYGFYLYARNAQVFWSVTEALEVINDVRWLRFSMLNGDGVTRTLRKIGLYPDINTRISPAGGSYNHEWDYLGPSITSYESSTNLALGATASGSSYFGVQYPARVTDGVINVSADSASLYDVWGSESSAPQWISIDLGATYSIYRVKIYHGYDDIDTQYMLTDYKVQTSTDDQTYTDRFTISSNSSFERTHDLAEPVAARYVRIYMTDWDYYTAYLRTDVEGNMDAFKGAVLREVQVFEYYGYPSISSEEYPVICLNMRDQFFVDSHSIVGFDAEDSSEDWSNASWNFTYSDSVLTEPQKVDFRAWGDDPYYDQWAAVKMDSATNYMGGPHYLKHVRIECTDDQNPCNYPWWWQSNVSTISRTYDYDVENCISAMKIEYPASTAAETISFIEGDNFGNDEYASWRDGFNFRFRISDPNSLDLSYGYFYLGGYDSTDSENPILYKWNISTLSGTLTASGTENTWIDFYLRFKTADEVEYIEQPLGEDDARIVSDMTLGSVGVVFRGIGNPITMYLDGFKIMRNHFQDYSSWGQGLYLHKDDYMTIPLGEYGLSKGTIEFWIRPDYSHTAYDYYNILKNRAIFYCNNNANDIFGLMFSYHGIEVYFGNIAEGVYSFTLEDLGMNLIDYLFHLAFVFSNDGTQIDSDGSTVRIYFDNVLIAKSDVTWTIHDNKHFNFILGGKSALSVKQNQWTETSSVDAVISQFKIYNYCKLDFADSIKNVEDSYDSLVKPSSLVEISRDNLTYYKARDPNLPFKFNQVPANDVVPIYTRLDLPDNLTGKEIRTAGLLVYWDVSG